MNSGQTAERVYDTLKAHIRDRAFQPGTRLDPTRLAERLLSSATPVRDALNRLTGEGLVRTRTSDGFHLPAIDAPGLQDLYDWNAAVLTLALRATPAGQASFAAPRAGSAADRIAAYFAFVAARSGNAEHARTIASLNDRLHAVRLTEGEIVADGDAETDLLVLEAAENQGDLRRSIAAYHHRRRRVAAEIVRALYRSPPTFAE